MVVVLVRKVESSLLWRALVAAPVAGVGGQRNQGWHFVGRYLRVRSGSRRWSCGGWGSGRRGGWRGSRGGFVVTVHAGWGFIRTARFRMLGIIWVLVFGGCVGFGR